MSGDQIKPEDVFDQVVRMGCLAADGPVINAHGTTGAERTRIAVAEALRALEANGIIRILPPREWPEMFKLRRKG